MQQWVACLARALVTMIGLFMASGTIKRRSPMTDSTEAMDERRAKVLAQQRGTPDLWRGCLVDACAIRLSDLEAGMGWQDISSAPKDGAWFLARGYNSADRPMIPMVVSWHHGVGVSGDRTWRDSASLRDVSGNIAEWMSLPSSPFAAQIGEEK